jgi:predicted ArsR family transcriptional regulator
VPPEAVAVLMRLLAAPEGTTASEAGLALGKSKETAREYLTALRDRELAQLTGGGRGSRWRLVRAEPPAASGSRPYLTIEALAQYVVDGLVDADSDQRAVLEKAHDMIRRQRLTLVQGGGGDTP